MSSKEIRQRIDELNETIRNNFSSQFTLNFEINDAINEIRDIQEHQCSHEYKDGFCSICGRAQD